VIVPRGWARAVALLALPIAACSLDLAPLDTSGNGTSGCTGYCERATVLPCFAISMADCTSACEDDANYYARCAPEYDALIACAAAGGSFICNNDVPELTNCLVEQEVFYECVWAIEPACSATPITSAGSCYATSDCNPITNEPCASGQVCDWASDTGYYYLRCWDNPGIFSEPLCAPCSVQQGPWCQPGLSCVGPAAGSTSCAEYCCTDADCGGKPGSCARWGATDLRFCAT
jgi:hypothetical protein